MTTFYANIPPIERMADITDDNHYFDVPADWHIALCDVKGSTVAIKNGRYKDVNAVAAASITAMLNVAKREDIPFVFGGDGSSVLIPESILSGAHDALIATQQLAKKQFDLDLRIGIVPVKDVLEAGYRIRVGKLKMSDNFQQAVFMGGGLAQAEQMLKDPFKGLLYRVESVIDVDYEGDFSGFECRWNAIPTPHEENVALMVLAVKGDRDTHNHIYREVLQKIEDIYGDTLARRPISVQNMTLATNPQSFATEAKIRHQDTSMGRLLNILRGTLLARIAMKFNIGGWGKYKEIVASAIDNEKFDDTLRMIISGTTSQRGRLRTYLEERRQKGDIVYGTHTSLHALMTCVVFDYFGRQVHFIDGADGGYALAAMEMKDQIREIGLDTGLVK